MDNLMGQYDNEPFRTSAWVEKTIEQFNAKVSNLSAPNGRENDITRLSSLLETLEAQERSIYQMLGVTDANGIQEIQRRADEFKKDPLAARFLDQDFAFEIYGAVTGAVKSEALTSELQELVDYSAENNLILAEDTIADLLNRIGNLSGKSKFKISSNQGLNAKFDIVYDTNSGRFKVVTKENKGESFVSGRTIDKIIGTTDKINGQSLQSLKGQVPTEWQGWTGIIEAIKQMENCTPALKTKLTKEINKYKQAGEKAPYACFANTNSVQGFLAELYWNLALEKIFGSKKVIATGNILNEQGKSLSVDALVKTTFGAAGFQIKSWHTKELNTEGTHTVTREPRADTFVISNAGLGESDELGKLLLSIFGIYAFNQPIPDATNDYKKLYEDAFGSDGSILCESMQEIFSGYINKLLRIDNGGNALENILLDGIDNKKFLNTFWLINDNIIPSSLIIKNLIEQMKNSSETKKYTSLEITKIVKKADKKWEQKGDNMVYPTIREAAKQAQVVYKLRFDLGAMLNALGRKLN